ncbi:MAG: hypothetical protein ABW034_19860 [Steroidobacteraceae bacterium]
MSTRIRNVVFCTVIAVFGMDAGAAVPAYRPQNPQTVLLHLGDAGGQLEQWRRSARDPQSLAGYVRALIKTAGRTGDERYYGYAEQALRTQAAPNDLELQLLQAQLLQHRHQFAAAESELSALLDRDPHDRAARLMRAQVRLHLKQPDAAMRDCVALMPVVDIATATTCIAQARAALGDLTHAYALVTATLRSPSPDAVRASWSSGVAAELAARLGDNAAAERWFNAANRLDPESHFARVSYADWLLWQGDNRRALQIANNGKSIADRTRAVLAARSANSDAARTLQLLWREASARGERDHLRDLARFHWFVLRDARGAHAIALDNFRNHREGEDALLLAQTARATKDRAALMQVFRWQQDSRYRDVRLDHLLRALA